MTILFSTAQSSINIELKFDTLTKIFDPLLFTIWLFKNLILVFKEAVIIGLFEATCVGNIVYFATLC